MKAKTVAFLFLNFAIAFSCSNEVIPNDSLIQGSGTMLVFEKMKMANGTIRLATEYRYNELGQLSSRISYSEQGAVSSKEDYFYDDNRLVRRAGMSDVSSSTNALHYVYFYSTYEYDQDVLVKQNFFYKQGEAYQQRSYAVYEYNESALLVKQSVFNILDQLVRFTIYVHDQVGNISGVKEYDVVNSFGLTWETTYEHDSRKNPYKTVYTTMELIPYSINSNNITKTVTINHVYPSTPTGDVGQSETSYKQYNTDDYPVIFSENGGLDIILEYQ